MTIEQLRKKYLYEDEIKKKITKKGGGKMPRIFRYAIYLGIIILFWKFVNNIDAIVGFLIKVFFGINL